MPRGNELFLQYFRHSVSLGGGRRPGLVLLGLTLCGFASMGRANAEPRHLTLAEAVRIAVSQNRTLKLSRLKVDELAHHQRAERTTYFPVIENSSHILHTTELENIGLPAGALGVYPGTGLVPGENIRIEQGSNTVFSSGTTLVQPVTQLIRIHQANRIAGSQVAAAKDGVQGMETKIAFQVHQLYFGLLTAQLQKQAAEHQLSARTEQLRESEESVKEGSALPVNRLSAQAELLEAKQALLTTRLQSEDLNTELNDVLGFPLDTELVLDVPKPAPEEARKKEDYVQTALSESPELREALEHVRQASAGVTAARSAYIPDITALARHSYQDGIPFLVRNFGTFGVSLKYEVFDFGKKREVVKQRESQLAAAEENVRRLKSELAVKVERSYNRMEQSRALVDVAQSALETRQEAERVTRNQVEQSEAVGSMRAQAVAATAKARADLLKATLGYLLAIAELDQVTGRVPGL